MAFIKVDRKGVVQFVDEGNTAQLLALKKEEGVEFELDASGEAVKRYTEAQVRKFLGRVSEKVTPEQLLGISKAESTGSDKDK